jgi:hypothetical protein
MTTQLIGKNGKAIANQFVHSSQGETVFQSYNTIVAKIVESKEGKQIILDTKALNYSDTNTSHLTTFLGYDSTKELRKDLDSFKFENLNE